MATTAALEITEILSTILDFCSPKDLCVVARTCRTWSELALQSLWMDLDSITPLVTLLSPLEKVSEEPVRWAYPANFFTLEQYERLEFYGSFVRTIVYDDAIQLNGQTGILESSVYLNIAAAFIGRQPFLPNLQYLRCKIQYEQTSGGIGVLASSELTDLVLDIQCQKGAPMVFESLRRRLPHLRSISITTSPTISLQDVEVPLSRFLADSPHLLQVSLPQFFLSKRVSETLGTLGKLESLLQTEGGNLKYPMNQHGCNLEFDSGGFQYLTELQFNMSLKRATDLFLSSNAPDSLTHLTIATRMVTEEGDLRKFLRALASSNPQLRDIELNLHTDKTLRDPEAITFRMLAPLLELDLDGFLIAHDQPLSYTDTDIMDMVEAWPNLKWLYLNEEVAISDSSTPPPGLDINHMILFASFPQLEELGLYIQVKPEFRAPSISPYPRLKQLEEFSLGTSVLTCPAASEEIAMFIATLMPKSDTQVIATYSSWLPQRAESGQNTTWEEVFKLWPKFCRAQEMLHPELEAKDNELETQIELMASLLANNDRLMEENRVLKENMQLVDSLRSREKELQAEIEKLNSLLNQRKDNELNQQS